MANVHKSGLLTRIGEFRLSYNKKKEFGPRGTLYGIVLISAASIIVGIICFVVYSKVYRCTNISRDKYDESVCTPSYLYSGSVIRRFNMRYEVLQTVAYTGDVLSCYVNSTRLFIRAMPISMPYMIWDNVIVCNDDIILNIKDIVVDDLYMQIYNMMINILNDPSTSTCAGYPVRGMQYLHNVYLERYYDDGSYLYSDSQYSICYCSFCNFKDVVYFQVNNAILDDLNNYIIPINYTCEQCVRVWDSPWVIFVNVITGVASFIGIIYTLTLILLKYVSDKCNHNPNADGQHSNNNNNLDDSTNSNTNSSARKSLLTN